MGPIRVLDHKPVVKVDKALVHVPCLASVPDNALLGNQVESTLCIKELEEHRFPC